MNAITNRKASAAIHAIPPSSPSLPPDISHAVAGLLDPVHGRGQFGEDDPGHYIEPASLPPHRWQEAQRLAERFDALLAPVTQEILAAWLLPVNAASRNPQAPQDFAMRVAGIAEMVADLPAAAFTAEARRRLDTGFFPSHEDVRAAIEPTSAPWLRKRNALRSLRQRAPEDAARPAQRDPAEIDAVRAKAAAFYAEMNAKAAVTRAAASNPLPLNPAALLAAYEAAGTPAALFRAEQIRRALDA